MYRPFGVGLTVFLNMLDAKILAMYLGCRVSILNTEETRDLYEGELSAIDLNGTFATISEGALEFQLEFSDFKLILRPLESITDEESVEYQRLQRFNPREDWSFAKATAEVTKYLLSKSFDLFGLIQKGLAIESRQ